ncbi:MAG TPA: HAMP domain-containing sensor histidine kinase, partial [Flavisolibacter sp.]|nr:HAMP domain-containing sensor histidine kinase [Flavisolibacter sp.]
MPVRIRITILFAVMVFLILGFVCLGIYYFSFSARESFIKTRLANRAITTARLLSQREVFDRELIRKIDSSTTISLKNKALQAYDVQNRRIYRYSDIPGDTIAIDTSLLAKVRSVGQVFFTSSGKEVVGYHYTEPGISLVMVCGGEDEEGINNLRTLQKILLLSFSAGLLVALAGGYFFSGGLLRPIKRITGEVKEISAQNLARRIEEGTVKDEWYRLSATLNELLNRLQESFELQRRFISNASHELSTPLTSISSQLEVSLQRERAAGDYRQVMQSIYQDVQHMSKLTQTLLEFAKASGNAGGLEIDLVRIDEIVLQLPSEMARIDPAYNVSLSFDNLPEDEEKLLVFGNEALLLTAIRNIVINACKYSPDHQASILLRAAGNQVSVVVSDKGMGIPEAERENIFQPFYRVNENRAAGGFGLGLSLANRIVKLHKGLIEVSSPPEGGTRFIVQLPAAGMME